MTNEHHTIGESELIECVIDAVTSQLLEREIDAEERQQLQQSVQEQIEGMRSHGRRSVRETLSEKSVFTPPELAREWGVSPDKILGWIRSGELRAVNMAQSQSGRPRYRIDAEAIQDFKAKRANHSPPPQTRRRRRPSGVIEFF